MAPERQPAPGAAVTDAGGDEHFSYRRLFDEVPAGLSVLGRDLCIRAINPELARMLGYEVHELVGLNFLELQHPEERERAKRSAEKLLRGETARFRANARCLHRSGRVIWMQVQGTALPDADGRPAHSVYAIEDITERLQAQEELRRSEERFRMLVTSVEDFAIFMLDPEGRVASWNAGAQRFKGYRADEIIGEHFSRFYTAQDVSARKPWRELEIAQAEGRLQEEGWRQRKNGTKFWANVVITALRDESGTLIGYSKVTRDRTERRAKDAAREMQFQVTSVLADAANLLDAAPQLLAAVCARTECDAAELWVVHQRGDAFARLAEWRRSPPAGAVAAGPAGPGPLASERLVALARERAQPVRLVDLSGDTGPEETAPAAVGPQAAIAVPVASDGTVVAVILCFGPAVEQSDDALLGELEDLGRQIGQFHRRRVAELARAEAEEHLRAVFEHAAVGIARIDASGRIEAANPALARLLGTEGADLAGRVVDDLIHPDDRVPVRRMLRRLQAGDVDELHRQVGCRRSDGGTSVGSLTMSAVRDVQGVLRYCVALIEDVTERARAQERTAHALAREQQLVDELRKLDAMKSEFVSRVSHELRTPLTSIIGYTELLAGGEAGQLQPEQDRMVAIVERNAQRLLSLIEDLLTLGRIEGGAFGIRLEGVQVAPLLEAAHRAVLPVAQARGLSLTLELAPDLGSIRADGEQLDRAILNLLTNAIKFTAPGGRVVLTARRERDRLHVAVTDSGIGVPVEEQGQLFRRFFRSSAAVRNQVQGTGLGLAIVKSIVDQHHGEIRVESAPGRGSRFELILPASPPC